MNYRKLGSIDFQASEIGFGAWAIGGSWGAQDDGDSLKALHAALDAGVNFIDTAAGYGNGHSERLIGQVIKERKEAIFVATKTPPTDGTWPPDPYADAAVRYSETYLRANIEERLRCLGTEAIDLLQLHTWTRAWNRDPKPLEILQKLKQEGKIRAIGISTPEHDQNCVIDLMRAGLVDSVQLIYNIFEQEPAAELLPVAQETGTAVIVRVAFDEGMLTGKYTAATQFPEGDFRSNYFAGDRLARAAKRVDAIREDLAQIAGFNFTMAQTALKFVLSHPAVSTVIPGIRTVAQAQLNTAVSDLPPLEPSVLQVLYQHAWRRAFWYGGK
jgi:aryl-alcohol dehydrogenase-like predicted oxidoreductase